MHLTVRVELHSTILYDISEETYSTKQRKRPSAYLQIGPHEVCDNIARL